MNKFLKINIAAYLAMFLSSFACIHASQSILEKGTTLNLEGQLAKVEIRQNHTFQSLGEVNVKNSTFLTAQNSHSVFYKLNISGESTITNAGDLIADELDVEGKSFTNSGQITVNNSFLVSKTFQNNGGFFKSLTIATLRNESSFINKTDATFAQAFIAEEKSTFTNTGTVTFQGVTLNFAMNWDGSDGTIMADHSILTIMNPESEFGTIKLKSSTLDLSKIKNTYKKKLNVEFWDDYCTIHCYNPNILEDIKFTKSTNITDVRVTRMEGKGTDWPESFKEIVQKPTFIIEKGSSFVVSGGIEKTEDGNTLNYGAKLII